jgi:hypothetical protein
VIDHDSYVLLQDIIRREGRSFLQYAGESFPWNTPDQQHVVDQIQTMVLEERADAGALARYLVKHHLTPPYLGPYPSYFTSYNFMSLDRLVALLIVHQKRDLAGIERDMLLLPPGVRDALLQNVLVTKKRHLQILESLTVPAAPTAA